jgi:hypothetical protein
MRKSNYKAFLPSLGWCQDQQVWQSNPKTPPTQ